jgi:hypothetical protein
VSVVGVHQKGKNTAQLNRSDMETLMCDFVVLRLLLMFDLSVIKPREKTRITFELSTHEQTDVLIRNAATN